MNDVFAIPIPEEFENQRLTVDFGLRTALLAHKNAVVPYIGTVSFLRQMTWSLAAIYLCTEYKDEATRHKLHVSATSVANAIEALACKAKYNPELRDFEYRGSRAFGREWNDGFFYRKNVWTFDWLSRTKNYVQNTYRQSASAAIYDLNLTEASSRYNSMRLTNEGRSIALEFLQQNVFGKNVISYLYSWVRKPNGLPLSIDNWRKFAKKMDPAALTSKEKKLYESIFEEKIRYNENQILMPRMKNCVSQKKLLLSLNKNDEIEVSYYNEICAAMAFDDFLDATKKLFSKCIELMASNICNLKELENRLETEIRCVKAKGKLYLRFNKFAHGSSKVGDIINSKFGHMLNLIISDNKSIIVKNNEVNKGSLFAAAKRWSYENNQRENADKKWPLSRLYQWHSLCVDCGICK